MSDSPTVSVIIPTYNRAHFITGAINSVLNQIYTDYEIIIIDDGSTDDTRETIEQFDDERIRYVYQDNKGVSAARNHGMKIARGQFFAFLDSDDEFLPTKLEKQIIYFQNNPATDMVCAGSSIDYRGKYTKKYIPPFSENIYRELFFTRRIGTPTMMLRRHIIDTVGGFDEILTIGEDGDFVLRIARHFKVDVMPEVLVNVRFHDANTYLDPVKTKKTWFYVVNKQFDNPELGWLFKRRVYARGYYHIGLTYVSAIPSQIKSGLIYFTKGFVTWPFDREGLLLISRLGFRTLFPKTIKSPLRRIWRRWK